MVGTPSRGHQGLSATDVATRLATDGPNRLPSPRRPSASRRFAGQLFHFFALMLWVASGLAFVAQLPELGIAIIVVIVFNAAFAFAQEGRATAAADRLRSLLPRRVIARRDGQLVEVDADSVVVDDVLELGPGDRVPADVTVAESHQLLVDTSLLTGESVPTALVEGDRAFGGTFVVEGEATVVVTATGTRTRLAEIARLTTVTPDPTSPLTVELARVVRTIAVIAVGVGVSFFGLAWLLGTAPSEGFVFAIGVTVALVPEGLLPTVTLSLSWGAEQMARRQVLVRHLDAVETLGSTTFICTDKTGTLTRNQMTVIEVWTPSGSATVHGVGYDPAGHVECVAAAPAAGEIAAARAAVVELARAAARCSNGRTALTDGEWVPIGDPMEVALDVLARRCEIDTGADRLANPPSRRFPFDPRRRRMSVVVDGALLVKGAPDAVLPRCRSVEEAGDALSSMTDRGLRALAIARGDGRRWRDGDDPDQVERDLDLLGLVGLEDPPRDDVRDAIDACRRAHIKVAMITGDHPVTASAIADQVGLRRRGDPVLVGADLPDDLGAIATMVDHDGVVVARVSPEDKLRIAQALRRRGHIVAMTGDGVNDGPALHEADIGVAMGRSGTDVAREAADLVLLDDHFASIVGAVEQGRASYVNLRRFLTYHLTDNVAELTPFVVWALSGGRFPLALGVMQILALDIGTDTLSAVALGAEPSSPTLLEGPPVSGRLLNATVARRAFGVLGPTEAAMSMMAFLVSFAAAGWRPGDGFPEGATLESASGAAFMAVVIGQAANAFACRSSTRRIGSLGWRSNRLLPPAVLFSLGLSAVMLFAGPVADELEQANPPLAGWVVALASAPMVLLADRFDKWHRGRRPPRPHHDQPAAATR